LELFSFKQVLSETNSARALSRRDVAHATLAALIGVRA
jgi:hypothetical protein